MNVYDAERMADILAPVGYICTPFLVTQPYEAAPFLPPLRLSGRRKKSPAVPPDAPAPAPARLALLLTPAQG